MITLAAFVDVVASCKPSAPGPDGVPYGAWGSDIRAQVVLYSAYVTWLLHGYVPVFFNASYLWLLPKCSPDDGIFNPCDTRPLSGANTDAKIFAMGLSSCFNYVIGNWANHF